MTAGDWTGLALMGVLVPMLGYSLFAGYRAPRWVRPVATLIDPAVAAERLSRDPRPHRRVGDARYGMTLTEALAALQRAGRIRSCWSPGMRGIATSWVGEHGTGQAFRMLAMHRNGGAFVHDERMFTRVDAVSDLFLARAMLDLSDPATVGCLLALLREAAGSEHIYAMLVAPAHAVDWPEWQGVRWQVFHNTSIPTGWWADTEGEAIADALIALAGGAR